MERVHTTWDFLEAHLIVASMRRERIDAWVFDGEFVRLDWFSMPAYGGFRIVVRSADRASATDFLERYRQGELALAEEPGRACPRCGHDDSRPDPQPRRNVFCAFLLSQYVPLLLIVPGRVSEAAALGALGLSVLSALIPGLTMRHYKWAERCSHCGHRWSAPPTQSWQELNRAVEDAAATDAVRP